jgi:hypothetical protein
MNTVQKIVSISLLSVLFGCSSIPANTNREEFRSVRNQTINLPTQYSVLHTRRKLNWSNA